MTDIVERLRVGVYGINRITWCEEAAIEIEQLRAGVIDKLLSSKIKVKHKFYDDQFGITGSTYIVPSSIEIEDDGAITIVIDN